MSEQSFEKLIEDAEQKEKKDARLMKPIVPKYHSSLIPHARFDVAVPDTTVSENKILGVKIPRTDVYNTTPCKICVPNTMRKIRY